VGLSYEQIEDAIRITFGRKGDEVVNLNLAALKAGRDEADQQMR
jgi:indolepyruvate ferredoxin oxidoreductase beta subunit